MNAWFPPRPITRCQEHTPAVFRARSSAGRPRRTALWLKTALLVILAAFLAVPGSALARGSGQENEECPRSYRVQRGDTLTKIAKRCGTSLQELIQFNPQIANPNRIFTGDRVLIPTPEERRRRADQVQDNPEDFTILANPAPPSRDDFERAGIDPDGDEKWIFIDLSEQILTAYRGGDAVMTFLVSTGRRGTPTVTGRFEIYVKYRTDDMRGPGYFLKDVPYTMYFHGAYGIHGTYWHDNFGVPMSRGCVNMKTEDARWLYSFAAIGTTVYVRK